MQSALIAKEQLNADTPLFLFDCTLADGTVSYWSSRSIHWNGNLYLARLLRHNLFEAQMASSTQIGGAPRLTFELANADSLLSQIERQTGFKGAQLTVRSLFVDPVAAAATTDAAVVFKGLINPPELITESSFRLSAMNRMSTQRSLLPEVRVQRVCPWRFPTTAPQRLEAVDGGPVKGKFSPFFRCGYSPDQSAGVGNLNGTVPFTSCSRSRSDCEQRGMFNKDSAGRLTGRFGGIEYVPPTILVRGAGQKNSQLSAVQNNTARYNDFVPLVYGTQWHVPDVVFSRNDGNLTRMETLLGMGEIQGILKVLVNDIEIPRGVTGINMTSTGWYNLVSPGTRTGKQDDNFADSHGVPLGDPYGSMACLSIVVPNRINDGTSIPSVQVLMQGLKLWQFDGNGNSLGDQFSSNPAWVLLDILMRTGYGLSEIDTASFARAAAYADQLITVNDPVGGHVQLPRFQCEFALKDSRSAGEIVRSIHNGSRLYVTLNNSGLLEARVENTFALQQPVKPAGSNATSTFNGGWPAYEFDASSIARNKDGGATVKLSSKSSQDTPNKLSIEFQDSFNQYQQDSLSLANEDDQDLCGQKVAAAWDAVGIVTFNQAARMLLLGLNRAIEGNLSIEFETSVKALGLMPGDLITVTYAKESLLRTPFRITRITPGPGFRTAVITAQFHDDAWYSDTATGITGGQGKQTGNGSSTPAPVGGTVLDLHGNLQLGISETEVTESDGSTVVELDVSFTVPPAYSGTLPAPLLGLSPVVAPSGGTLAGGVNYYYAVSAVDLGGGEGALSFIAQATTPAASSSNQVTLTGIALPQGSAGFHVYRGFAPQALFRIASSQPPASTFIDAGAALQTILPPDPQFDHVNIDWRWELLPETQVSIHSSNTVGNPILQLNPARLASSIVRITRGAGAGQERTIASNTATTLSLVTPWTVEPDATSWFVVAENAWRSGARGTSSPISIAIPERIGAGVQVSARAANAADEQAPYDFSPLTRWILGQSGSLQGPPPAPYFGLALSPSRGGVLELGAPAFSSFTNTATIVAGTCRFHYYDEVNGAAPIALTASLGLSDALLPTTATLSSGTFLQLDQEILEVTGTPAAGTVSVTRGLHGSTPSIHPATSLAYILAEKVVIVPFIRNFFGSPASGDWKYTVELPNVRLASAELYMTNAIGDGEVTASCFTGNLDSGLRTLAGGQISFQIAGYLAIQTGAAPDLIVDADRAVRDIFAILRTPPTGAAVTLQLNRAGAPYATLSFADGASTSSVVPGFGLPPLRAGDHLSLDITAVGASNPGSDLTLVMRL